MPTAKPRHTTRRQLPGFIAPSLLAGAAILVAACGGGGAATTGPTAGGATTGATTMTPASGAPATAAAPSAGGGSDGAALEVILTGGPDAGTYAAAGEPLCTHGIAGANGWAASYINALAGDNDLAAFQFTFFPQGPVPDGLFPNTELFLSVSVGPPTASRTYAVKVTDNPDTSQGEGGASVLDIPKPVMLAHGTTDDASPVEIEATINCPSVTRA